jgi:hypothetical protein
VSANLSCFFPVLHCTALYCTALYYTALYCTVLYCTVLHFIALYCTVLYCTLLHCTVLYCGKGCQLHSSERPLYAADIQLEAPLGHFITSMPQCSTSLPHMEHRGAAFGPHLCEPWGQSFVLRLLKQHSPVPLVPSGFYYLTVRNTG